MGDDIAEWTVGTLVRHPVHGLGQVRSLRPSLKRTLVDVQFKSGFRKTLALEFAELERVVFDEVGCNGAEPEAFTMRHAVIMAGGAGVDFFVFSALGF